MLLGLTSCDGRPGLTDKPFATTITLIVAVDPSLGDHVVILKEETELEEPGIGRHSGT